MIEIIVGVVIGEFLYPPLKALAFIIYEAAKWLYEWVKARR